MIPPRSPYSLIQEDLWPDEWSILIACMLLNCTTRKQVEKVMPRLFAAYPTPQDMAAARPEDLSPIIARLGFGNRRACNLIRMSQHYLTSSWSHASELPGVGAYASAAWEIFIRGTLPPECPKDHALTKYYRWRKSRT